MAYWYFRLNGFLQIENFVIHPGGRGSQRTDADLLAVRFPHRAEFLLDRREPMRDDECTLRLSPKVIDIVIAEVKTNDPCKLNGPWTAPEFNIIIPGQNDEGALGLFLRKFLVGVTTRARPSISQAPWPGEHFEH